MSEILSQDEIDALLSAIETGETEMPDYSNVGERRRTRIADFRKIQLTKRQVNTLHDLHKSFVRDMEDHWARHTQVTSSLYLASTDQMSYREFLMCVPDLVNAAVFSPTSSSQRPAILYIPPVIAQTLLDILLGGRGRAGDPRVLTSVELSLLETQVVRMMTGIRNSWAEIADIRPSLGNIESRSALLRGLLPRETPCVVISIEVRLGDAEDIMSICYPLPTLRPFLKILNEEKLSGAPLPAGLTPPVMAIPFRGRYGFRDVFLPLENIPEVGDTLRLPTPGIFWRTL